MDNKCSIFILIFVLLIGLAFSTCHAQSNRKTDDNIIQDGNTYCFGRYLLTLPKGSTVKTQYIQAGADVETYTGISPEGYKAMIDNKQHELENTFQYSGDNMFVERDEISENHTTLVSWSSPYAQLIYSYIEFIYIPEHQSVYTFISQGNATKEARAIAAKNQRELSQYLQYRGEFEIPLEDGFCIDEGLIQMSEPNREEVLAVISIPDKPDLIIAFETHVTLNPGNSSGRIPFVLKALHFTAIKTLRNRKRKIGSIKGRERLTRHRKWDEKKASI